MISTDIKAYIEDSTVEAGSVSLTADDTSQIMAFAGSASAAAAFGGVGVAVSIGAAFAHNMIDNNVAAYIDSSTVTSTIGDITVYAVEHSQINAVSTAASVAFSGAGVAVSVSVGGIIVAVFVGVIGEGLNVGEVAKVAVAIFWRFSTLESWFD